MTDAFSISTDVITASAAMLGFNLPESLGMVLFDMDQSAVLSIYRKRAGLAL